MSFRQWLRAKRGQQDRVGDLARDVAIDTEIPRSMPDLVSWRTYLEDNNACEAALETLRIAWNAYTRENRKASR